VRLLILLNHDDALCHVLSSHACAANVDHNRPAAAAAATKVMTSSRNAASWQLQLILKQLNLKAPTIPGPQQQKQATTPPTVTK
jgi:hypothetical protein